MNNLLTLALSYPESEEGIACQGTALECPTATVRGNAFLFVGATKLKVKLGDSLPEATQLAKKAPACFQVGVHGWVTVVHSKDAPPPPEILTRWIDESYRLIAPKKLVAILGDNDPSSAAPKKPATKTSAKRN